MENVNNTNFFKLIKKHHCSGAESMALLVNGEIEHNPKIQLGDWAIHFSRLATPANKPHFDDQYRNHVHHNICVIDSLYNKPTQSTRITPCEVELAIRKLKPGKARDEMGLSAEHLKAAGPPLVETLSNLFTTMCNTGYFPDALKSGIVHPFGKKGKCSLQKDNYRGITISSVMGKVLEHILKSRWQPLSGELSSLQFGFTPGRSPSMASLLVSEADIEADEAGRLIYMCTLDAMKAFDTVDHQSMLFKLYSDASPEVYKAVRNLYEGTTSKVKWRGLVSKPFSIAQGVRQGGILSPDLYKLYINDLLKTYEKHPSSLRIGTTCVGSPTVADDVCLLSGTATGLQVMLNEAHHYSSRERYTLHPGKTAIVPMGRSSLHYMDTFLLGDSSIRPTVTAEHLGLTRSTWRTQSTTISRHKVSLGRRTAYSLMGTGLHGTNGVDAKTSYRIYRTYVLPRVLYGLEVIYLKKGDLDALETMHRELLRMFQSLPPRTANAATYLLVGASPFKAELDMRRLALLGSIIRSADMTLRELAVRQIAVKDAESKSWFVTTAQLLILYNLPTISELLRDPPNKPRWRRAVNRAVKGYWCTHLTAEADTKTTLYQLNTGKLKIGWPHPCWDTVSPSVKDVRRAITKVRMLTGTYCTQVMRNVYSRGKTPPTCLLCWSADEDLYHLLLDCPALHDARCRYLPELREIVESHYGCTRWVELCNNRDVLLQLIVDCSSLTKVIKDRKVRDDIERSSRCLCHSIHCARSRLLGM